MLRRCAFADKHFEMHDPNCPFVSLEDDPITKTKVGCWERSFFSVLGRQQG